VELVFTHCYPRLDANVSKTQNHLLKSPFCVHPKTGRVCIPIDPREVEKFNPFTVPTVRSVCEEIDEYDRQHRREDGASVAASSTSANSFESSAASVMSGADDIDGPVSDIEKTSLKSSVDFFNRQFLRDLSLNNSKAIRDRADEQAAFSVDF
jgi:DNA primase small subunit